MLTKLSALYHYLLKNNHLDEALDILKLASFNQGENTRIFEERFPSLQPNKEWADRFYEIFGPWKDYEGYRALLASQTEEGIEGFIILCEGLLAQIKQKLQDLGLPERPALGQAKAYMHKFSDKINSPEFLANVNAISSKTEFFNLMRSEKKSLDPRLTADQVQGLSPKEIDWVIKVLDIAEGGGEAHSAEDAISMVKTFEREKDRFDKKIWEFDSYSAAQEYLESQYKTSEAAYMHSIKDAAEENDMSRVVYESDKWKVVLIGSTIGGQWWRYKMKADSSLCIGTLKNNLFANYSLRGGIDPYFIIDKAELESGSTENPMRMFSVATERREDGSAKIQEQANEEGTNLSSMTNALNRGISMSQIRQTLGAEYKQVMEAILTDANSRKETLGKQNFEKIEGLISSREVAQNNIKKIYMNIPEYIAADKLDELLALDISEITRAAGEKLLLAENAKNYYVNIYGKGLDDLDEKLWTLKNINLPDTDITTLPEGLNVSGNLNLMGCKSLTTLPEGLTVGGDLGLSGCRSLTTLPEGLSVGSDLSLANCASLTNLPEGLTVRGILHLGYCKSLKALPEGLTVGGDLILIECKSLTTLPEGITVGGDLNLSETGITTLPEGITVGGDLDLSETGITTLPKGLTFRGDLVLMGCISLTTLPEGLTVEGELELSYCKSLTTLPEGITVGGDLNLSETGITTLPEGITVGGDLILIECKSLTTLLKGLRVAGNLDLSYCESLQSLPEGLTVGGDLILIECMSLTALPEGLTVGGDLYIEDTRIRSIPSSAKINGKIIRL